MILVYKLVTNFTNINKTFMLSLSVSFYIIYEKIESVIIVIILL